MKMYHRAPTIQKVQTLSKLINLINMINENNDGQQMMKTIQCSLQTPD
jgi:hypothetical protein